MTYNPNLPNAYDTGLIPYEVDPNYFQEMLFESPLDMFMGTGPQSVIQIKQKAKGTGLTDTFSLLRQIDYKNTVQGYSQISGKGQQVSFYSDTITAQQNAISVEMQGIQLTEFTTPIDVYNALRPELKIAHQQSIAYRLLMAATAESYADRTANGPDTNRVIYQGVAYDASINTAVASMTGADATHSGCSVAGILALRYIAKNGGTPGNYRQEKLITPYRMQTERGYSSPYYVYFMNPASYKSLSEDQKWSAFYYRNMMEKNQPSLIESSGLRGQIDNVLIVEVPELGNKEMQISSGGKTAAWNLFVGAQAFGMLWCGTPRYAQEKTNMESNVQMGIIDIRGHTSIKFPSYRDNTKTIENSIIHHFTQI